MISKDMAQRAYGESAAPTRTPRTLEYDAIARTTRRMNLAAKKGKTGFSELAAALHENRQLWTLFASSVADEDNALPKHLRAQLFYLAEFTHQHSSKILEGKARVRPLLEINTAVLKGLRDAKVTA